MRGLGLVTRKHFCLFPACFDGAFQSLETSTKHGAKVFGLADSSLGGYVQPFMNYAPHDDDREIDLGGSDRKFARAIVGQWNQRQKLFVCPEPSLRQDLCADLEVADTWTFFRQTVYSAQDLADVISYGVGPISHARRGKPCGSHFVGVPAATIARRYPYSGDSCSCRPYGSHDVPEVFCGRRQHSIAKHRSKHKANHTKASSKPFPKFVHPTSFLRSIVA